MTTQVRLAAAVVGIVVGMWMAGVAGAQVVNRDFYNRGGVALYEPEIGVVASGPVMVVRPTVSADRKYVTMATSPQLTQVVRIERFPVATFGVGGYVGGARPASALAVNASAPVQIRKSEKRFVLNEAGITWLAAP